MINELHPEEGVRYPKETLHVWNKIDDRRNGGGAGSGDSLSNGKPLYGQWVHGHTGMAFGGGVTIGTCDNFGGGIG